MSKGAIYVENSKNSKIMGSQPVDSTYASIKHSCPDTCPLKDTVCYAQLSFTAITNKRLERRAKNSKAIDIARAEAKAIDNAYQGGRVPDGRACRIHVSGDSKTVKGTRLINAAIKRWKQRGGNVAWSYTHSWKNVPREAWNQVSILASVTSTKEVKLARQRGYAPAIVVDYHPSDKAYQLPGSDVKWIPCPQQTRGVGCSDCKLCFDSDRLYKNNMGISFAVHGSRKDNFKRRLTVIK